MLAGTLAMLDRVETSAKLSPSQRRRLRYGRNRWIHMFRPQRTLAYRLLLIYYKFRAVFDVPLRAYYDEIRASMR
jgi:hypothetical protein